MLIYDDWRGNDYDHNVDDDQCHDSDFDYDYDDGKE